MPATKGTLRHFSQWSHDLPAGLVVFLIALPLCLGISLAANAPIVAGLLSGIVGGVVVGFLSGSHTSVSGPSPGLTAVIAAQLAILGSFEAFLPAVLLAGLIQISLGLFRAGFIASYFPSSVIKGLLSAIGIILVLKQLPHLVGLDLDYLGDMTFRQRDNENTFSEILNIFSNIHPSAAFIGFASLALLVSWNKIPLFKKIRIPAAVMVVAFGIGVSLILPLLDPSWTISSDHLVVVPVVGGFFELGKLLTFPSFANFANMDVIIAGCTLAFVASLETLLNLEAVDKIDPQQRKSPPNRELIAQGIGNSILGLIGGLPITSVVIRSSVNINAKAKTKLSTISHGLLLLTFVVIFPQVLNLIPLSCLAAILIVTGAKLFSSKILQDMWKQGLNQFLPFATTVTAIVLTDLLVGVLSGLTISLLFILKSSVRGQIRVEKENRLVGELNRIILPVQVSFLMRGVLMEVLDNLPHNTHAVFDASESEYIDADVLDLLKDFKTTSAPARNIVVSLVGFKDSYDVINTIHYSEHVTSELQKTAQIPEILKLFKEGNLRVREGRRLRRDLNRQINATSSGQFPLAVILSCIDSRAPAELIFDLGIGDILNIRMAGNVTSSKVLGSLEFACAIAGARLIVVMGHTKCGAISASLDAYKSGDNIHLSTGCEHLQSIVKDISNVIQCTQPNLHENCSHAELLDKITKENVLASIQTIKRESSKLNKLLSLGKIGIVGCVYDVTSGSVEFLPEDETSFEWIVPTAKVTHENV